MKKLLLSFLMLTSLTSYACTTCNRSLQEAIFNSTFYPNLFLLLSAFIVLAVLVALLVAVTAAKEKKSPAFKDNQVTAVPMFTATIILGIGIGGFIDGTVLHQILQWHEMLSNKIPPVTLLAKSVNMFWDGIFHAFCLIVTLIGLAMLFRLYKRKDIIINSRIFTGGLIFGWGLFNIIEGVIDHQMLKLHNVREVALNVAAWNYGFLFSSVILLIAGWLLFRKGAASPYITTHPL